MTFNVKCNHRVITFYPYTFLSYLLSKFTQERLKQMENDGI